MHRNTPIFFLEAQPARGKSSTGSATLARMKPSDALEKLSNVAGIRIGTPIQDLTTNKWHIEGQQLLSDQRVMEILKKFMIKPNDWVGRGGDDDMDEDEDIDEDDE